MDFEAEMNDGGFEQYLNSESSNYIYETINSFINIGRIDIANIIKEIVDSFPNGIIPLDQKDRADILELLLNEGHIFQKIEYRLELDLNDDYLTMIESLKKD